jgi:hypothetical protein
MVMLLLNFTAWAFPFTDLADRMATNLTLLLAQTAFKYTANEAMPNVPYLTVCDVYIMGAFSLMVLIDFQHSACYMATLRIDSSMLDKLGWGVACTDDQVVFSPYSESADRDGFEECKLHKWVQWIDTTAGYMFFAAFILLHLWMYYSYKRLTKKAHRILNTKMIQEHSRKDKNRELQKQIRDEWQVLRNGASSVIEKAKGLGVGATSLRRRR